MVVNAFKAATEEQHGFSNPEEDCVEVREVAAELGIEPIPQPDSQPGMESGQASGSEPVPSVTMTRDVEHGFRREENSLGVLDVPLMREWVQQMLKEDPGMEGYYEAYGRSPEEDPSPLVKHIQYEKLIIKDGVEFYIGRDTPEAEKESLKELLLEFKDVFAWSHQELTGIDPAYGEHRIDVEDNARPVRQRQYRLNPKHSLKVKEELDTLLEAGFIYPVKHSEWVSPIVIAPKKVGADGKVKIRVCQDYRKLNEATKKDAYPLPFTDIILDHVAGHMVYTFLDGMAGYHQTNIRLCDQIYTTFITDWGTYAFRRMPFGLCNAPWTFQRIMRDIFHDFMRYFLEVFIDEFAVFSKSWEEHLEHLRMTFERCREANLKLHPGKCFIKMDSGILLGHRVSEQGIAVDLEKVTAILALRRPSNVKEVRGFLGMVGYYRRFVEGYAKLALPLTELLKKETPFQWTERQEEAFKELKMRMVKAPMMVAPDFDKVFHVTSDASGFCVGVILWQYG